LTGLIEAAGVEHQLGVEAQHVRHGLGLLGVVGWSLRWRSTSQNRIGALHGVGHVFAQGPPGLQHGGSAATCSNSRPSEQRWQFRGDGRVTRRLARVLGHLWISLRLQPVA
jgi:hypothetical protein